MKIGLDVGSTTLKCVVLDAKQQILFQKYERHFSRIPEKSSAMLREIAEAFPNEREVCLSVSGSAGMGFAEQMGIPFVQEVYATRVSVRTLLPDTDAVIELGGEDAKILFLSGAFEVRMNGSCAGGTGAFIDQMATLLGVSPDEMNELSKASEKTYAIASRCGVFAKSDIQPLLNQGARREDISASIFASVVNQTVAGLAQGREIVGNVLYLGGPLTFFSELRKCFDQTLNTTGLCPDHSLYFVAIGAALLAEETTFSLSELIEKTAVYSSEGGYMADLPLFSDQSEYEAFCARHGQDKIGHALPADSKELYVGIDAGSTTLKAVAINENEQIVYSAYRKNAGNPVPLVKEILQEIDSLCPDLPIRASATTGYGEEIIKNAFHADYGVVETVAHFLAARRYDPQVDFIIDIGGQDIKCFKVHNGSIDNIFLNEACSSGCGSFLQTFAGSLGYDVETFASLGLFADRPVDLGSRCTVFMNSSVKQAQKDGASIENISAGLSVSVVKNAIYKVIRASDADSLGKHIVVQGGTFLNDAVLRAFEREIGRNVTRPPIAGLMGAYGAALYAKSRGCGQSTLLRGEQLTSFRHEVKAIVCNGCTNACRLTVNTFGDGRRFIGGNQCEKPMGNAEAKESYNLYEYKRQLLAAYKPCEGRRGIIGLPMGLNFYELLPFWYTLWTSLGFGVRLSPPSSKSLYHKGQQSIPSDTVCYPAKLMHGHIASLADMGVDAVFYPCLSYHIDEHLGDNHYNCPVVAYYPEVIGANMKGIRLIRDYVGIHRPADFTKTMHKIVCREFGDIPFREVKQAVNAAYAAYEAHKKALRAKGEDYLQLAQDKGLRTIILAGRPYHVDGEINHGIDKYIASLGAVVVSEDSLADRYEKRPHAVLNQWTFHARMYEAARFAAESERDIALMQLVSFGCGLDAVTGDEVRRILEEKGKIYTQIKIDEITNLGAVKIRIRSLFAALDLKKGG
ncbi:MAG: 2-hydroxyglutaryl-CoA dehydratase [Ruminococcaceae bacterium]|nr:2-hydroxyglutaryl-CoA dehydratase [Oscillospiraceae bacterium]